MALIRALVELKVRPERHAGFDQVAMRIARFDEVVDCLLMSGRYDLLLIVEGPDLQAISAFVFEKLATIDQVADTATHFIMKKYKEQGVLMSDPDVLDRLIVSP